MSATLPFAETEITGTIAARFQYVVAYRPDQLAVLADDGAFSYGAIDNIAERIAQAIGSQQPPNSGPLAILLPQSAQTLAALLGCLKAGYSFLVLPPTFPLPRLRAIWADARSPLLLTDSRRWQQALTITTTPAQCLNLEQLAASKPASAGNAVPTTSTTSELAALFYTSGTTGEPKGVMWSQSLVLHTARQNQILYGLTPQDRIAILTSFGFGAAMTLAFAALLNGATVCLMDQQLSDPAALLRQLQQQAATVLGLPPVGLFRQMMDTLESGPTTGRGTDRVLSALRLVLLGGQPLRRQDVTRFYHCFGEQVMLRYRLASSETMLMCDLPITPQTVYPGDDIPVGYAAPDKEILLLDEDRQPVKLGEIGEIAVRSRYLAAGYWQALTLTAATFLADPTDADRRLCYTGDMGRMTPDGLLFHLGRKDNMVKVRGYRVQLEAVEAAFIRLNAIDEAVVVAHTTRNGEKQLLAYYTSKANPPPTTTALRQDLLAHLPEFMLPARFIALASLPRNATGKLDRSALPRPGAARPALGAPFVAPQNEQEQQIADIWAELLELDEVGIDDNFFELGGDSLTAMTMLFRVEQKSGNPVPTDCLRRPTVRELVKSLNAEHPIVQIEIKSPPPDRPFVYPVALLPVLRRLNHHGPLLRGHAVPYGVGTRLQHFWIKVPAIQRRLRARMQPFLQWCELVDLLNPVDQEVALSMLANSWQAWRHQAIREEKAFNKWVTMRGAQHLDEALASGRAIIFVGTHTAIKGSAWQMAVWQRSGHDVYTLGYSPKREVDAVEKVLKARELLQNRGFVQITGDGAQGRTGFEIPLAGQPWLFRSGGAELALALDAILLPVFNTMDIDGKIVVEFLAPFTSSANSHELQVEELTHQYASLLNQRWTTLLSNMKWGKLDQIYTYAENERRRVP